MREKTDLLDGWITESTPTLLAAFGESAIERLKERVLDEKLDLYIRGSIATALNVIAHQHPDKKEEIKAFLSKLLEDTNVDWVFDLPEKEQSYFKFMKSPLEHFSRERICYLKKISYPEKETTTKKTKMKIGRNDPCPCGSGKKYKKCCLLKGTK